VAKFQRVLASGGELFSTHRFTDSSADSGLPSVQETLCLLGFYQLEHRWAQMKHRFSSRKAVPAKAEIKIGCRSSFAWATKDKDAEAEWSGELTMAMQNATFVSWFWS